jgi:hypothetical protein
LSVLSAFIDGLNRVKRAPWLVIGVWLSTLLLALPLTLVLTNRSPGISAPAWRRRLPPTE